MLDLICSFAYRLADVMLGTAKTIFLTKAKYVLSAFFASMSMLFGMKATVIAARADNDFSIYMMCLATFIGTLCTGKLIRRTEPDDLYVFDITASDVPAGKEMAKKLAEYSMNYRTELARDTKSRETLKITVHCYTQDESRIVLDMMPDDFKYNAYAAAIASGTHKEK